MRPFSPDDRTGSGAPSACWIEPLDVAGCLPLRKKDSHKGDFGKVLLLAGSEGMCGAAVLAARAALRAGCGLLTVASVRENRQILQVSVPEALFRANEDMDWKTLRSYDAIGIGCGWGRSEESLLLLKNVLRFAGSPLVVDADGLNLLAENPTLLEFLPEGKTVLTPHRKEFERLAGKFSDKEEMMAMQQEFSNRHGVVVVLKGAHTSITVPAPLGKVNPILINPTGNPGMATGGSGDVLTGILASLLGQGLPASKAAYAAVYLHGLAGDLAAEGLGEYSLIAGDVTDHLPQAFLAVRDYAAGKGQGVAGA